MIVVTSGVRYIDIDAYACSVAYAELFNLLGKPAIAASTAVLNESITGTLRSRSAAFATGYVPAPDDTFVIVDVSDPSQFDKLVDVERVVEVLDHHPGFEAYWSDKIGIHSHIEFIGAAATLVYERWQTTRQLHEMSQVSAELLAAAILDNTLKFGAGVTTARDRAAYDFLAKHAVLDDTWVAQYFTECQQAILADLTTALHNDTKFLTFKGLEGELCFGQLVIWDGRQVISRDLGTLAGILGSMGKLWLANVVSIQDGRSYFIAENHKVQTWLHELIGTTFKKSVAASDRLWLRKEIMKAASTDRPR